ncbi:MAG: chromate efflux transporter [Ardenticatenaceae bacterium]|nr:chromate efflux transporter [Ardenticatenaceae bacterium]
MSEKAETETPLRELARLFLRLGLTAFGGPAAHIAMMEDEVIERRGWMTRQHFLDLVGATSLIPGPNSTEMTMHVGFERGGWRGLFIAGATFIFPAVILTGILAWLYVEYGTLPQAELLLLGIKPAVMAIILSAVWKLGKKALKGWPTYVIGLVILVVSFLPINPAVILLAGGVIGAIFIRIVNRDESDGAPPDNDKTAGMLPPLLTGGLLVTAAAAAVPISLWRLGLVFLKIGAVLYGSGYVLVAFLERDLVNQLGWLTQAQLLDAIAIGQFTPGPVLSTATFIGFLVAGVPGAVVATVGIFLPSFLFVLGLNPLIPRLRQWVWTAAFLDAVNVAAVALMAAVTFELGRETLISWQTWVIAVLAAAAVFRFKVNSAWIVLGGALLGLGLQLF